MAKLNDSDARGDVYEYLLSKLATAGVNGQFRTPRHIIKMMVELMDPKADDVICDPSCGTAGFLVSSAEYIRKKYEDSMTDEQWENFDGPGFTGFDTDPTMLRISAMNLMLHSIKNPEIDYKDSVSKQNEIKEKYRVNPDDIKIVATGGYSELISASSKYIEIIEPDLMLEGLMLIYERNHDR